MSKYELRQREVDGVLQDDSYDVLVNGKKVARYTGGCLFDVEGPITVILMEFLVLHYKRSHDLPVERLFGQNRS